MSTLPKPQRQPKETHPVAHRTLSSRVAGRSLVEYTCCRAGARDWVCAQCVRLQSGRNLADGANLSPRRANARAGPGPSLGTLGPSLGMRAAVGRDGSCLLAAPALLGAQMTPGVDLAIWVRSSIP
uniref:Protein F n=1 Tax=Hepacivirus hominis TaxID=3052230 RepID=A0A6M3B054_9HEPC|nr:protein F [Hepacivirus hominis]